MNRARDIQYFANMYRKFRDFPHLTFQRRIWKLSMDKALNNSSESMHGKAKTKISTVPGMDDRSS